MIEVKNKQEEFLDDFNNLLSLYDEEFFSLGNIKEDYKYITSVIKHQGYWSGVYYRFYYDQDMNYLNARSKY